MQRYDIKSESNSVLMLIWIEWTKITNQWIELIDR